MRNPRRVSHRSSAKPSLKAKLAALPEEPKMTKEVFDLVDEHNNPTGKKVTKQQAHDQGHIHRIAAVLVFLPNGKLLIQAHKVWNRRLDHSVGGHVRFGETYLEAAKREMQEELGLSSSLEAIDIVKPGNRHFESHDPIIRHNYGIYETKAPKNWRFVPNEEVDQVLEMSIEEVVKAANNEPDKFLKGFLTSLAAYLRIKKSSHQIIAYGKNWGEL